jgi:hypothetical protein
MAAAAPVVNLVGNQLFASSALTFKQTPVER